MPPVGLVNIAAFAQALPTLGSSTAQVAQVLLSQIFLPLLQLTLSSKLRYGDTH